MQSSGHRVERGMEVANKTRRVKEGEQRQIFPDKRRFCGRRERTLGADFGYVSEAVAMRDMYISLRVVNERERERERKYSDALLCIRYLILRNRSFHVLGEIRIVSSCLFGGCIAGAPVLQLR